MGCVPGAAGKEKQVKEGNINAMTTLKQQQCDSFDAMIDVRCVCIAHVIG